MVWTTRRAVADRLEELLTRTVSSWLSKRRRSSQSWRGRLCSSFGTWWIRLYQLLMRKDLPLSLHVFEKIEHSRQVGTVRRISSFVSSP
jgi:hypothetical protein